MSLYRTAYGIDLRDGAAKVVRAERRRGGVYFTASTIEAAAADAAHSASTAIAGALVSRKSFTRWIETPFSQRRKAWRVLPTVLDIQLPFALEDCVYDFVALDKTPAGCCRALAAVARRQDLEAALAAYQAAGVNPHIVDQEGLALWEQALRERPAPGDDDTARAIVWSVSGRGALVIGRGSRLIGAHPLTQPDAARMDRLLRAALGDPGPLTWYLAGTPDGVAAAREQIASAPATDWPGSVETLGDADTLLARAVAVRAVRAGTHRCNLRTGPLAHPLWQRRASRRVLRAAAALWLAAAVLFGGSVTARYRVATQLAAVDARIARQVDELAGFHVTAKGEHALRVVRETLDRRRQQLTPFAAAFELRTARALQAITATAAQHELTLSRLTIDTETLRVSGTAPDWDRCEVLAQTVTRLRREVRLKREDAVASERVPFTLTAGAAR